MPHALDTRLAAYRRDGYTVFKGYMPPTRLAAIRRQVDPEFDRRFAQNPDIARSTIANLLSHEELSPLFRPHLLDPTLLDFAEHVMGPCVQLDSFEITGFPRRPPEQRNTVAQWHRDAFNYSDMWATHGSSHHREDRVYTAPTACNCLTYLQDMNAETGSLRIVVDSHMDYTHIPPEDREKPHPNERLLTLDAGDMVFTHNEILHAGSTNTADQTRYFVSAYVQRFGLPHRDTFQHPLIDALKEDARQRNDRRVLRLFGEDPLFEQRERAAWKKMIAEDRAALNSPKDR